MVKSYLKTVKQVGSSFLPVAFLFACSPQSPVTPPAIVQSEAPWTLSDITLDDIHFTRNKLQFEFDTLGYDIYARINPVDESRFQSRCEGLTLESEKLKYILVDAEKIGLSEGRHGFDRGIDHCILTATVFVKNGVYDLVLTAFGVGVLWPAEPGMPERYFLAKNCDHSRSYIEWYFEETDTHPGLEDFQSGEEVLSYFCSKEMSE